MVNIQTYFFFFLFLVLSVESDWEGIKKAISTYTVGYVWFAHCVHMFFDCMIRCVSIPVVAVNKNQNTKKKSKAVTL